MFIVQIWISLKEKSFWIYCNVVWYGHNTFTPTVYITITWLWQFGDQESIYVTACKVKNKPIHGFTEKRSAEVSVILNSTK